MMPWFAVFRALPMAWRDRLYETVARNPVGWVGKRGTSYPPHQKLADRVLARASAARSAGGKGPEADGARDWAPPRRAAPAA